MDKHARGFHSVCIEVVVDGICFLCERRGLADKRRDQMTAAVAVLLLHT